MASLYEIDFYAWSQQTADKIRLRRFDEIDAEALAEEVESLGRSERNHLRTRLTLILAHLLNWEFQHEKRDRHGRSWQATIREQRRRVARLLEEMPSLRTAASDVVEDAYESAVIHAAQETGLIEEDFPRRCPYTLDEILNPESWPGPA
jgi:hypothetical protein